MRLKHDATMRLHLTSCKVDTHLRVRYQSVRGGGGGRGKGGNGCVTHTLHPHKCSTGGWAMCWTLACACMMVGHRATHVRTCKLTQQQGTSPPLSASITPAGGTELPFPCPH